MSLGDRWQEIRGGFQRPFWVANTTELFERLAFYAPKAVLTLYLVETLKFSREQAGALTGIFGFVVWFLPVIGGVIADRFGFRRTLATAYLVLTVGYFLLGSVMAGFLAPIRDAVPMYWFVLGILLVPALGPGIVKPIVAGTTARASADSVRSLGFSLYYTIVNIGGMLGPIMAYQVRTTIGIENVFRVSALTTFAMFVVTLLFYEEPARNTTERATLAQSVRNMLMVFGNVRFITLLLIFSGFYVVFWQQYVALPLFLQDVNPAANADLLLSVDPATVVLLTVPVGLLLRKAPAFPTIIAGVLVASLSWLVLTLGGSTVLVIVTLFILAMGELILSPKYYDYVSRLAPPGQTATFMGFSFLPVAVGDLAGSPLGGWLAQHYGTELHQPHRMWLVVTGVGLVTTALLFLYNMFVKPLTPASASTTPGTP